MTTEQIVKSESITENDDVGDDTPKSKPFIKKIPYITISGWLAAAVVGVYLYTYINASATTKIMRVFGF